jgi:hypothetical protein
LEKSDTPEGLHPLQYARHILEEHLARPATKGNLELIGECISAVSKARKLTLKQAHKYLERAVDLAKEQGIKMDRFWFEQGEYLHIRPKKTDTYEYIPPPKWVLDLGEQNRQKMLKLLEAKKMDKAPAEKVAKR